MAWILPQALTMVTFPILVASRFLAQLPKWKKSFHSAHLGYEKNHHILQVIATPQLDREMETWK